MSWDLVTISKVAEVLDGLEPQADGVRHVVLDLRGLTPMDLVGLRELQVQRVLEICGLTEALPLADEPLG